MTSESNSESAGQRVTDEVTKRVIESGEITGADGADGSLVWLGIPYAQPPVGDLRWRAPRPPAKWASCRAMLTAGSPCTQPAFGAASLVGSEDCLYLNVWSPKLSPAQIAIGAEPLPVLFWIHGGGNVIGRADHFDGSTLATSQNVIVVTANYRLGVSGWFRHSALRDESTSRGEQSGNFGTLDLIQALYWVRANISQFGGDPRRVTIMGESAGGSNVFCLLASPLAAGLFQRAIVQSGFIDSVAPARAENRIDESIPGTPKSSSEMILRLLIRDKKAVDRESAIAQAERMQGGPIAEYLRSKTLAELAAAYADIADTEVEMAFAFGIPQLFADGHVLPQGGIVSAFADGCYNKVPVILGSTRDEYSVLLPMALSPFVQWDTGSGAVKIPDPDRFNLAVEYASRLWKANNVDVPACALARHQPESIFVYRFDWAELSPATWWDNLQLGATHGLDVPFVFGNRRLGPEYIQIPLIQGQAVASYDDLSAKVRSYWGQFAASGSPAAGQRGELPAWSPWSGVNSVGSMMLLDATAAGGVRMVDAALTKDQILTKLELDERLGSAQGRCDFARDLLNIRGGGLGRDDYQRLVAANGC